MIPKFLVIDDDSDVRTLMQVMLQALGCESVTADGGVQALQILQNKQLVEQFDAVFLDVMMPDISGLDVLKAIKESPDLSHLPVIMLTAKDRSDDIIDGYKGGADYYIPKPFTKEQIIYGLDLVLGEDAEDPQTKAVTPVVLSEF